MPIKQGLLKEIKATIQPKRSVIAHNAVTLVHFKRQNRSAFTPLTKAKPPPAYILKFPLLMGRLLFKYSFRIGAAYKIPNLYVSSIEGRPTQRQIGLSLC
jgi:hypothetical protein